MRLERKLQLGAGRSTLLRAAALLIGWELIRSEVVDKVRGFFIIGFDQLGFTYDDAYQSRVVARGPHLFDAQAGDSAVGGSRQDRGPSGRRVGFRSLCLCWLWLFGLPGSGFAPARLRDGEWR